jgi:hypothetical protein
MMEQLDESMAPDENTFDCIIWLGDMNYRINGVIGPIAHAMNKNMYEVLLDNDQLNIERKIGRIAQIFKEGEILFPPTYKLLKHDDAYNTTRIPSWTDRILYYSKESEAMTQYSYDCNNLLKLSDHRPVFSQFEFHYEFTEGFATLRKGDLGLKQMQAAIIRTDDDLIIKNGPANKQQSRQEIQE